MPLCNTPLIEYTLEILAITDVAEVFIICTNHIDKIKEYFEYVYFVITIIYRNVATETKKSFIH